MKQRQRSKLVSTSAVTTVGLTCGHRRWQLGDRVQLLVLLVITGIICCDYVDAQQASPVTVRNVRVLVCDDRVIETATVHLRDGRIASIDENDSSDRSEDTIIDGTGLTMLPGLIDTHVHLFAGNRGIGRLAHEEELKEDIPKRLAGYLRAGVTTIKSTGDPTSLILKLREDLRASPSSGPRLLVTGPGITTADGWPTHIAGTDTWWRAEHCREIATEHEARQTVRSLVKQGVDAVKLYHDGGPIAPNGDTFPKLALDVVRAAIDEAHRQGLRATVHTWSVADAMRVIKAGADGLEHGVVADIATPELFQMMAKRKAFYVPTLSVYRFAGRDETIGLRNLSAARNAQTPIALGSDTFTSEPLKIYPPHGANSWNEFEWMLKSGMRNSEVIRAATRDAAEHLGILHDVGTVETGKCADLILTEVDPLKEIPKLAEIVLVFRAGAIVYDSRSERK